MLFIIYAAVTLAIGIAALCTIFWFHKKLHLLELTEETSGVITKITQSSLGTTPDSTVMARQIKVKYTINGKDYRTSMQYQGDRIFEIGQEATVLYDPDKPSRAVPKDFEPEKARYYWKLCMILMIGFFVVALIVTGITLPNTLGLSKETKRRYDFGMHLFFTAAMPIAYFRFSRTESYKAEKKRDPKGTRSAFLGGAALWGKFLIDLIWDIIEMFVF